MNNLPLWDEYTCILLGRFGEICDDPMAKLMQLWQKGSITKYHEEFDAIVSRVDLSSSHQLSCFLGGMKQDMQMMVRMFQPTTIIKVFSLAKMYESASTQSSPHKSFSKPLKFNPTIKTPLLSTPSDQVDKAKPSAQVKKTLTPTYMSERRSKGLCYFCDEPFTPAHSLTHKKLQIHVMELEEEVDSEAKKSAGQHSGTNEIVDPLISVNALTGLTNFRTMRVTG